LGDDSSEKRSSAKEEENTKYLEKENNAQRHIFLFLCNRSLRVLRKTTLSPADVANISPGISNSIRNLSKNAGMVNRNLNSP
jgi:hypothetical protein